ncbi:hypothetical protein [Haloferula sp.]|uniref:DUF2017 family protein n=1 Tax=Haloferula sp. TaxID=2497595 RepID=UPI003C724DD4
MKAAPTLDGRIRIDIESEVDWMIMQAIPHDARSSGIDLADRLGDVPDVGSLKADWQEFVVPELSLGFSRQLTTIEQVLAGLDAEAPAPIFIVKEEAELWYGGLNQARLALEDRYHFHGDDPEEMTPGKRTAWFRSQFYTTLQSLLLEFLMRD